MASVDYKKCKAGSGSAEALLRHCDARERLKHGHSNEHLDTRRTGLNKQGPRSYEETIAALRDRLAELDRQPDANRRKDRVEMFMLEVPVPSDANLESFCQMVVEEVGKKYGERNVLNWYLHCDEVHEYYDAGEIKTSLEHVHIPVVPEVDGKLNGRAFSSRANMRDMNRRIDGRAREMGVRFLTGDPARNKSVEQLKLESYRKLTAENDRLQREIAAAEIEIQSAKEAKRTAEEATEAAKAGKRAIEAEFAAYDAVLARIEDEGGLASRKHYKEIDGREYVRVYADEIPAVNAAAILGGLLLEAEEQARENVANEGR